MSVTHLTCRIYEDFLCALSETYGQKPFTLADLAEKGLHLPGKRTLKFFQLRGVVEVARAGRPHQWRVSAECRAYLEKRRCAA
jgi:hypothetical protein